MITRPSLRARTLVSANAKSGSLHASLVDPTPRSVTGFPLFGLTSSASVPLAPSARDAYAAGPPRSHGRDVRP